MQIAAYHQGESQIGDLLIDDLHALRARVFHDQLKWAVTVRSGRERDEYDVLDPTHIVVLDRSSGRLLGGARLLPLSGPTMLNGPFSFLLEDGPFSHPSCLESSRFCIDRGASSTPQLVTRALVAGILAYAQSRAIETIATVTDIRLERYLTAQGLSFERLGPPRLVETNKAVAGLITVDPAMISHLLPIDCQIAFTALATAQAEQ